MTSSEKRELRQHVDIWKGEGRIWAGMLLFIILTAAFAILGTLIRFLFSFLTEFVPVFQERLFKAIALTSLMVLFCAWLRRRLWASPLSRHMKADLAGGIAKVHIVDVADSILVQEHEDEGPTVFIKTENSETLVFAGQELDIYTKRGFPWSRFEIVEGPASGFFLGLRRLGPPLTPLVVSGPVPRSEVKEYRDVFRRKWCRLQTSFDDVKKKRIQMANAADSQQPTTSDASLTDG
jgi:hypothetical protein